MQRRLKLVLSLVGVIVAIPLPASAHGFGGRLDLPMPLGVFVVATALVLVATFVVVSLRWPTARMQEAPPEQDGRPLRGLWNGLGGLGGFLLALTVVAGIVGIDNSARNPAAVIVFVGFWLVIPFVAALVVDLYPAISPWRRLLHWLGLDSSERPEMLGRLGYWPATAVFLLFTWFELVAPDNGPRSIAIAAIVFTLYMLGMGMWLGPATATRTADGFAVYARFVGAMAPFTFHDGVWRRRGWMRGLATLPERTGMAAFVVAMIGTVAYDGAWSTVWWLTTIRDPLVSALQSWDLTLRSSDVVAGTLGWGAVTLAVGLTYYGASWVTARLGGSGDGARPVATRFAHTLIPIGFAYAFAHYFTLVIFEGQLFLSTFSDPFTLGWDLFGTADRRIDFSLLERSGEWVWYVQVAVIAAGHVGAVVLSHDRALVEFAHDRVVAARYAMLALIVLLSGLALVLTAA
jgi:hypothetical protein